jgi:hypothetical protein
MAYGEMPLASDFFIGFATGSRLDDQQLIAETSAQPPRERELVELCAE